MKKLLLLALAALVGLCYSLPAAAQQQQGDKKFEVGGEVRFRGDYTDSVTDFDDTDPNDDAQVLWPWRVRAAVHGSFTRNVSGHVEFQVFGAAGDGSNGIFDETGTSDFGTETHLYQGWLELGDIGGTSFDLRLGRQELVYGSEMLLGDADFYNGAVHDGGKAGWQYRKWSLDAWYTRFVEVATVGDIFPVSGQAEDTEFYGAYAVFKAPKKVGFDAYLLFLNDNFAALSVPSGGPDPREERWTYGGRVYSKWDSNWSWFGELAIQTGEFDGPSAPCTPSPCDISGALGLEAELAYQWRKAKVRPRVYGRYSMYTGDDDDASESEAFDPLFQDFHARNGYMDLVRATNLNVVRLGVSWNGKEDRHIFGVDVLQFTLNEEIDIDPTAAIELEDDLGQELDLYYKYAYSKNVDIVAAIAEFSPGDVIESGTAPGDTAPDVMPTADDSARRVYVNTRLRW